MSTAVGRRYFHVFKQGKLTVIGFEGKHLANSPRAADCVRNLLQILEETGCRVLVVDLMQLEIVSSWILGVLATVRRCGIKVHVYHPSLEICDVLHATRFDELFSIRGLSTRIPANSVSSSSLMGTACSNSPAAFAHSV